jgi:hypothetical protein
MKWILNNKKKNRIENQVIKGPKTTTQKNFQQNEN